MIVVEYVASSLGFVSSLFAALQSKLLLSFVAFIGSTMAVLNISVHEEENDERIKSAFYAVDSMTGVAIAITCAFATSMHKTCFGAARLMWIVTMVTASSSYSFFAELVDNDVLPNDISLIAISVSSGLLILSAIYMRCNKRKKTEENENTLKRISECFLICGAFLLRFDKDIRKYTTVRVGVVGFHICLWCAVASSSKITDLNI